MRNNLNFFFKILTWLFLLVNNAIAVDQFNFKITELKITNNGNKYYGYGGGTATTIDGNTIIKANKFEYDKIKNILVATENVVIEDKINDVILYCNKLTYYKDQERFITEKYTKANIESKYEMISKNIEFLKSKNQVSSNFFTTIKDINLTLYEMDKFTFSIQNKILKGENIRIVNDYSVPIKETDEYYFERGIFNLSSKDFLAEDTKINVKNDIFNVPENKPRLYGVSSKKKGNITTINKGVYTSCGSGGNCPSWKIESEKITHDKDKRQIIYDDAFLKLYNIPILYFPKFFHPDPSVKRQSGFLTPQINNSEILGSSLHIPYYHVIDVDKDITFKPTIFENDIYMFQNEYRQRKKNSYFISDFGFTKGYKSSLPNSNKNSIAHLFTKYKLDFNFDNFQSSELELNFEKVNNDTYLKLFDTNLIDKEIKPLDQNNLYSNIKLNLIHDNYSLVTGIDVYESLSGKNSDRYQYNLPYYNFTKNLFSNSLLSLNFSSLGDNNLTNTNRLKSRIINDFNLNSKKFKTDSGFLYNLESNLKNLNTLGKNDITYKSSPQSELLNIYNFQTSYPLIKEEEDHYNYLIPKISARFNPSDMKNHSITDREINTNNIFTTNRLALSDSYEGGKSITLGLDYKKEQVKNINKYFEFKLATVIRDKNENKIPNSTTLNQKYSNIFGSSEYNISENINLAYNFAVDNDLKTFEKNDITTTFLLNNLKTTFNFSEQDGKMGNSNTISNTTELNLDDRNFLYFNTRKNRKTNLTEFYDLVYEYKNDCLTAGIKYKKTYYNDRDVKPNEDLLFTITIFPITEYEQKIDQNLYRK